MRKLFALIALVSFTTMIVSCGGGSKKEGSKDDDPYGEYEAPEEEGPSSEDQIAQGKTLVDAADCKTCHHATNKIIGPSHTDVAKKYEFTEENVKMLADKIIKGGAGVWGEVLMNAHPDLSQGDAEKMARYVLSLDGEKER